MDVRTEAEAERLLARQYHRDAAQTRLGLIVFDADHVLAERALTGAIRLTEKDIRDAEAWKLRSKLVLGVLYAELQRIRRYRLRVVGGRR